MFLGIKFPLIGLLLISLSFSLYGRDMLVFSEESVKNDDIFYYSLDEAGVISPIQALDNITWLGISKNGKHFFIKKNQDLFLGSLLTNKFNQLTFDSQQIFDIVLSDSGVCYIVMDDGNNQSSLFAYGNEYYEITKVLDFQKRVTSLLVSEDSHFFIAKSGSVFKGTIDIYRENSLVKSISGKEMQLYDIDKNSFYFSMDEKLQLLEFSTLNINVLFNRQKEPNSYFYRDGTYLIGSDGRMAFSLFEDGKDAKRLIISDINQNENIVISETINDKFNTPRFWIDQYDLRGIESLLNDK